MREPAIDIPAISLSTQSTIAHHNAVIQYARLILSVKAILRSSLSSALYSSG
jgi:hypothetical protein